jgi:hypothetical protein
MSDEESDDNGLCCKEIAIETRAFREANGVRWPPSPFMVHVVCENGSDILFPVRSVERVVEIVQELNPQFTHVCAMPEEHEPLLLELRAHTAAKLAANITAPSEPQQPANVLH